MYYFISDVHLGLLERQTDRKREDLLLKVLDKISIDAKEIFLVGDIFDYWFEYKEVVPSHFYRTLNKIDELKQKGIPITYIMGNHDFGHKSFFLNEFNIKIERGDIERIINSKKFYISHGDGKSKNDIGYLILKKILRSPISNFLFRLIHPDLGIKLAKGSSSTSRDHTDKKDYGSNDGMKEFAFKKLEEGFDFVVMGHRHKAETIAHSNGYYINLGEWLKTPTFGVYDGNHFTIVDVNDFLK